MSEYDIKSKAALICAVGSTVFPFLHFYSVNHGNELFSDRVFIIFALASIGILGLLLITFLFVGSKLLRMPVYRLAAVFSGAIVLFFLFKPIHSPAVEVLKEVGATPAAVLVYLTLSLLALLLVWHLAERKVFHIATAMFVVLMIAGSSVRLVTASIATLTQADPTESGATGQPNLVSREASSLGPLPNIYYVITDGYASLDVLKEHMGFEDETVYKLSTDYGYTHIPAAVSSYTATYLTLTSIFQGDYPVVETSPRYKNRKAFYPNILVKDEPPATIAAVKRLGYEFYLVGNQWTDCQGHHVKCLTGKEDRAPYLVLPYEVRLFIELTPVGFLHNNYGHLLEGDRRLSKADRRRKSGVDAAGKVLANFYAGNRPDGPFFMFVHHLPPHPPYMFEADCSPRQAFEFNMESWGKAAQPVYLENVSCTNRRLLELAAYLNEHDPEAIVVFQADHGSAFTVRWSAPVDGWSSEAIRERTSIFSFIRASEKCRHWLRPDLNSVNTLRFVLGCATGQAPRFVENESFISLYHETAADYGRFAEFDRLSTNALPHWTKMDSVAPSAAVFDQSCPLRPASSIFSIASVGCLSRLRCTLCPARERVQRTFWEVRLQNLEVFLKAISRS